MIRKIWSVMTTAIVAVFVLLAILLVGVRLVGYTPYAVLSGSMTPTYQVGDLVYVEKTPPVQICKGDVVTFVADKKLTVVTHRVIEVDRQQKTFKTKGDANDSPDMNPLYYDNVIGTVAFSIPKLGYVTTFVQTSTGKYVVFAALLVIILSEIALSVHKAQKRKNGKEEENDRKEEKADNSQ